MLIPFHHCGKFGRQAYAAEGHHPLDLFFIGDRHDPRFHRDMNSRQQCAFFKPVETVIVKEKLRNQMVGSGVHLGL